MRSQFQQLHKYQHKTIQFLSHVNHPSYKCPKNRQLFLNSYQSQPMKAFSTFRNLLRWFQPINVQLKPIAQLVHASRKKWKLILFPLFANQWMRLNIQFKNLFQLQQFVMCVWSATRFLKLISKVKNYTEMFNLDIIIQLKLRKE